MFPAVLHNFENCFITGFEGSRLRVSEHRLLRSILGRKRDVGGSRIMRSSIFSLFFNAEKKK